LAISVEVDADVMTARETSTTDDPIDATSTSNAVDNWAVDVADLHPPHGWVKTALNTEV
jgi:hypothetical protein